MKHLKTKPKKESKQKRNGFCQSVCVLQCVHCSMTDVFIKPFHSSHSQSIDLDKLSKLNWRKSVNNWTDNFNYTFNSMERNGRFHEFHEQDVVGCWLRNFLCSRLICNLTQFPCPLIEWRQYNWWITLSILIAFLRILSLMVWWSQTNGLDNPTNDRKNMIHKKIHQLQTFLWHFVVQL